jgi:NAD(P)-dependent dehydrogenase (short-subunit alcohol dehydrogenase family)
MANRRDASGTSLAAKRILVVGASAGIGRAVATAAVGAGANVVFSARRQQALESAVKSAGGGTPIAADVRDEAQVERMLAAAADALGGLDGLVYATGCSTFGALTDLSADDWRVVLETNVVGAALIGRYAVPHLEPANGVAFFLSSEAVGRPRFGLVHYGASKAALEELIRGFQMEQPEIRFTQVTVGQTGGTEFGNSFEPEDLAGVMDRWVAEGHMHARSMEASDLGQAIVELLATQIHHPDIDLRTAVIRSPGPLARPTSVSLSS